MQIYTRADLCIDLHSLLLHFVCIHTSKFTYNFISTLVNYSKQNDFVHTDKIWPFLGGFIMLNSILLMMLLIEELMKLMYWIQNPISPIYCIMVPFGICCIIHFCHIIRDEEFNKAVKKFDMTTPYVWSTNMVINQLSGNINC